LIDYEKTAEQLRTALSDAGAREVKAKRMAEIIRAHGNYRWVGLYDVNVSTALVSNIAWSGPRAPAYPTFPITKGLTSRAIATRKTVNIDDVAADSDYLVALDSTRSEIIVPVLSEDERQVIGTLDVESEHPNAFDHLTQRFLEECALLIRSFWSDVTMA
jgi:putative methionine-R-sulfoxide reductase with GAF domain